MSKEYNIGIYIRLSMADEDMVLCQELAQIKMRFSDAQLAIFCSLVILR